MDIQKLILPPIDNNTYIVSNAKRCIIIDPADGEKQILSIVEKYGFTVEAILITHAHHDHIFSLNEIKEKTGAPVYLHEADKDLLSDRMKRLGKPVPEIEHWLCGGETLDIIGKQVKVWHTPGHAMGCVCYTIDKSMFTGDTIFRGSVGRTDLDTSDPEAMRKTILALSAINEDYNLYCGHGDDSNLQYEIAMNPYFVQARNE